MFGLAGRSKKNDTRLTPAGVSLLFHFLMGPVCWLPAPLLPIICRDSVRGARGRDKKVGGDVFCLTVRLLTDMWESFARLSSLGDDVIIRAQTAHSNIPWASSSELLAKNELARLTPRPRPHLPSFVAPFCRHAKRVVITKVQDLFLDLSLSKFCGGTTIYERVVCVLRLSATHTWRCTIRR